MIDTDNLLRLIDEDDVRDFWCTDEEDRVEFLEALDSLGYLWASGNRLLSLTREDYMIDYDGLHGIDYCITPFDKSVTKSRIHCGIEVSSLITRDTPPDIDQSAIFTMLFETEVTA